jgi:hypothetical protein
MPFINLPPVVSEMFWDLDRRIRSLETAFRFNMPNVNFNTNIPTNPRVGDLYYDTYASQVTYWNGTEWVVIGDDNLGVPVIQWTSTWAGTGLAYTGTPAIGRYSRVGKMITYDIQVNCTNVTNFGTGQYSLTLPTGLAPARHYQHVGGLHKNADHYTLLVDLEPASTTVVMYHPAANGSQDIFSHNKPTTLTTASYFYISGTYFIS